MSRQRLRESSVQWNISLTNSSFAQKIIKLIEVNAIVKKAKIIKVQIPEKINTFLKENFNNDIKYLEKKNKIKINFDDDKSLLVPEYLIEFQNKSKKVLDKMENKIEIKKYHKENNDLKLNKKNFKVANNNKKKFYKRKNKKIK